MEKKENIPGILFISCHGPSASTMQQSRSQDGLSMAISIRKDTCYEKPRILTTHRRFSTADLLPTRVLPASVSSRPLPYSLSFFPRLAPSKLRMHPSPPQLLSTPSSHPSPERCCSTFASIPGPAFSANTSEPSE